MIVGIMFHDTIMSFLDTLDKKESSRIQSIGVIAGGVFNRQKRNFIIAQNYDYEFTMALMELIEGLGYSQRQEPERRVAKPKNLSNSITTESLQTKDHQRRTQEAGVT